MGKLKDKIQRGIRTNVPINGNLTASPFSLEESTKIRFAVKLSRRYRTDFYHDAIMSYSEKIIENYEASQSPQETLSEREALLCQEANNV
jgi:hypothetical protein